jgi:hypothetical protein
VNLLDKCWPKLCRDFSIRRQQREYYFARDRTRVIDTATAAHKILLMDYILIPENL